MCTPPVDTSLLEAAETVAREAADLTLRWFESGDLGLDHKEDGSPVTTADRAAEDHIRDRLHALFPDDGILGEERPPITGTSGRRWIVDPIDGTESFIRGVPLYSSLLAMVDEQGPAIGIVLAPALGKGAVAGRGRGCTWDGAPLRVNDVGDLTGACLSTTSFDRPWWPEDALLAVSGREGLLVRAWGDGYGYLLVAMGRIEAMTDPDLHEWDIAPMLTVIPEAGGRITRWDGSTQLSSGPWLASNGRVHDELLELLGP
jgi:histidinol phosphatase-like enzyme (inositol monophosphatase family)